MHARDASLVLRPARPDDRAAIYEIECLAFPTRAEADLVESLDDAGEVTLSLVAEQNDSILGHILCSRVKAEADGRSLSAVAIGPVAVRPDRQSRGIGAALVSDAVARIRDQGQEIIFLLGDPKFYGRFGFTAEAARPFDSQYASDHFMALPLVDLVLPRSGKVEYASAFAALESEE
jgi:putative acetyltransferase